MEGYRAHRFFFALMVPSGQIGAHPLRKHDAHGNGREHLSLSLAESVKLRDKVLTAGTRHMKRTAAHPLAAKRASVVRSWQESTSACFPFLPWLPLFPCR